MKLDPADYAFGPQPFRWRLPTLEGVTWRLARFDAEQNDLPRLEALWAEMDAKLGRQDRPSLTANMPVVLTLVAVDDRTGEIVSAVYGECVVDWTMIGTSRRAARTLGGLFPYLALYLHPRGIRIARVAVPRRMERHMARLLPGMTNISNALAWFVYMVRL